MLPWFIVGGLALLFLGRRPAVAPAVAQLPAPAQAGGLAPGVGGAPAGGVAGMLEPDDGVRGNFGALPLQYRPTVAGQVARLPQPYYSVFHAGEVATRPGVPDAVARSLEASELGFGDFL